MTSYSQRRGLQGVSSLRRKLRNMVKHVENSVKPAMIETIQNIERDAKQRVPVDTGDLRDSIESKVSADGLSAVAGPSAKSTIVKRALKGSEFNNKGVPRKVTALSKKKLFQFFKGFWHEFGTKGSPKDNIPPMDANPFMRPAWDVNEKSGIERIRTAINDMLKRASEL